MAYNKINYSAMCQGTWSEPSVMSWSAWLQLGWDDAVSLSGYISKCGYKPVLRPSDNFVFSNMCMVSGVLSNWAPKYTEEQNPKHSWHFRRHKMTSGRDEAKQSRRQTKICSSWPVAENTARNMRGCNSYAT